ncbi:NAD(P)-binding protein [Piscinibacter sp. HJYY11]|uniref:NAD(P)/FAD-dependent oxidoreductase n=1 Tax=Piscinibacter sp. HJYY11 TaxID=2801333 RepID=UPI00191E2B38|nr:NAD(P)-binding protein [Piscinibacter sp. HJYY11]MBL0726632.1 NAD(P)-binding protein [Piscinibacter sp. HJYY11]
MSLNFPRTVAVIGAGMSGAACAHALTLAGHAVHVFDKSRGAGGRLATRRFQWVERDGHASSTRLDHGAIGITARTAAFQSFVDDAVRAGELAAWAPVMAEGSLPLETNGPLHVPLPDMPAPCRRLLEAVPATWSFPVDTLQRGPLGWQLESAAQRHPATFDAVVLAIPPAQAAPLIGPHRPDWARHASVVTIQPCWTLMGVADAPDPAPTWDAARPPSGPLAWVLRNDARPGRPRVPGKAHWVVHARAGWSRRYLEQPACWVQLQLQSALGDWLQQPVDWHQSVVHRWRYALPAQHPVQPDPPFWWDDAQGLGVCGDFLGGAGVEGAWLSGRALANAMLQAEHQAACEELKHGFDAWRHHKAGGG